MLESMQEVMIRMWDDLLARPSGPLSFRFFLQPAMALIVAFKDGLKDARTGRAPYLRTILWEPSKRMARLREGLVDISRILVLGIVMDAIYQWLSLRTFYPTEAVVVAFALAFVPYLFARGFIARVARWWRGRHSTETPAPPTRR